MSKRDSARRLSNSPSGTFLGKMNNSMSEKMAFPDDDTDPLLSRKPALVGGVVNRSSSQPPHADTRRQSTSRSSNDGQDPSSERSYRDARSVDIEPSTDDRVSGCIPSRKASRSPSRRVCIQSEQITHGGRNSTPLVSTPDRPSWVCCPHFTRQSALNQWYDDLVGMHGCDESSAM